MVVGYSHDNKQVRTNNSAPMYRLCLVIVYMYNTVSIRIFLRYTTGILFPNTPKQSKNVIFLCCLNPSFTHFSVLLQSIIKILVKVSIF